MARAKYSAEQIIGKLREAEVLLSGGSAAAQASKQNGVTGRTCYRWRQENGGLKIDQAKRLKELAREDRRLRKAVVELTLDKLILAEAAKGNF